MYILRPAKKSDYNFIYHLKSVCLKEYVSATWDWNEEFQQSLIAEHFDPKEIQVIIFDGQDIGQLSLEDQGKSLFLAGIYILPAFQGRGIGSAILQDLLLNARSRQLLLCLRVLKVNPARNLYERLGFQLIGENETHYLMQYGK